ncbi:MAG TPA: hypothetical protein VJ932_09400, partial [Alkalispirochaeta sp.]|nr:hypothetical protein [Alkalispirochaeta sp.]
MVVALVFLLIGPASPAGAQETPRPWVLVAIPETPADEARNDILAEVIADTVELTLKLVGDYVIQPRPDSLARPASSGDAAALADELSLDYVVFGRVEEIDDGSTQFSLSVYNREQDEVILEREAVAHSLFETFSVADRLSADLLGAFTGQRIAYGSIELINEAPDPGEYRVLVDGELVGNSLALVERILIGPRRIEIVGVDGTRIESDAFIAEGHRSRLTFSVASPPEEPEVAQALPAEDTPNGIPPDPPEPAEPPLEWRVYPWSRGDPGRRDTPIWTSTFHLIREERSQWGTHGWGGGLTIRRDWGRRHSLMLEYSRMKPDWGDPDNGGGFQSELHAEDVTAETTLTYHPANLYRVATGYGVRLEPAVGVTVMPWWRVALERDGRRAMLQDETGEWMPVSFQEDEERAIFVPEVATGELFWNVVTGPAIAVEGSLRRASV